MKGYLMPSIKKLWKIVAVGVVAVGAGIVLLNSNQPKTENIPCVVQFSNDNKATFNVPGFKECAENAGIKAINEDAAGFSLRFGFSKLGIDLSCIKVKREREYIFKCSGVSHGIPDLQDDNTIKPFTGERSSFNGTKKQTLTNG